MEASVAWISPEGPVPVASMGNAASLSFVHCAAIHNESSLVQGEQPAGQEWSHSFSDLGCRLGPAITFQGPMGACVVQRAAQGACSPHHRRHSQRSH